MEKRFCLDTMHREDQFDINENIRFDLEEIADIEVDECGEYIEALLHVARFGDGMSTEFITALEDEINCIHDY